MKALMKILLLAGIVSIAAWAQNPGQIQQVTVDPTGLGCNTTQMALFTPTGALFSCKNGVYASVGGVAAAIPCVGNPGNTTLAAGQSCYTTSGATYICPLSGGCTTAGQLVAQPASTSGSTFPTATCSLGNTYIQTLTTGAAQYWDCGPVVNVWTNRTTGVTSSGAAAYNTGVLAEYQVSDSSGLNMPDTSGNGNNGTLASAGNSSPFGATPTITATGMLFNGGQSFNTCQFVFTPAAAWSGAQTVLAYYQPTAVPSLLSGLIAQNGSAFNLYESPGNGTLGFSTSSIDNPTTGATSQPWVGIVPAGFQTGSPTSIYFQGFPASAYYNTGNLSAATVTGNVTVGGWVNGGGCFQGNLYYLKTWSTVVPSTNFITEFARINTKLSLRALNLGNQLLAQKPLFIVDGSSIPEGYSASPSFTGNVDGLDNYATYANVLLGNQYNVVNMGINGQTLTAAVTNLTTKLIPIISTSTNAIVLASDVTNDLLGNSTMPALAITNLTTYCASVHAVKGAKCIVSTVLPRTVSGSTGTFSANRATFNASLRSGWKTTVGADALADFAADPTIGPDAAASNATYWNTDGIHPLAAANTIAAPYLSAAIQQAASGPTNPLSSFCASSASPAVCTTNRSGAVVVAAAATTVVINTTAVTTKSQILLTFDSSLGSLLGVTCNTTEPALYGVSARSAATSFTITSSAPITNPACFSYFIVN